MIRIIYPAVVNVPKPRLVPQAAEPVEKNASVKDKPEGSRIESKIIVSKKKEGYHPPPACFTKLL